MAHELIHYWFHPEQGAFYPFSPASRDKEKEWQANEGAAELLLPYRDFVPRYVQTVLETERDGLQPDSV